jgi:hypothetical protein
MLFEASSLSSFFCESYDIFQNEVTRLVTTKGRLLTARQSLMYYCYTSAVSTNNHVQILEETRWCTSNALGLYSGDLQFESRLG